MGRYKFCIYWELQIGLNIGWEDKTLMIDLPFISMYISFHKDAKGNNF